MNDPHPPLFDVAFVGAGNMATAMLRGLIEGGSDPQRLAAADPLPAQRERIAADGVVVSADNRTITADAASVVVAVKPQQVRPVCEDIADCLRSDCVVVSIAAGVPVATLAQALAADTAIVRCMPNMAAQVGRSATALYATPNTLDRQRHRAAGIAAAVGLVEWVAEEWMLDAVTAVSGSGPAYFFLLMEAMIDAGVELGLAPDVARRLVLQTAGGAAELAATGENEPATLRKQVTSPGGTTAAALDCMLDADLPGIMRRALVRARDRSLELSQS